MKNNESVNIIQSSYEKAQIKVDKIMHDSNKKEGLPKLIHIVKKWIDTERDIKFPKEPSNYHLKSGIVRAYEQDALSSYFNGEDFENQKKDFINYWTTYCSEILGTKKSIAFKTFISINDGLIPFEIMEIIKRHQKKEFDNIMMEELVESIKTYCDMIDLLYNKINEVLLEISLTQEDLDNYSASFGGKIKWEGAPEKIVELVLVLTNQEWLKLMSEKDVKDISSPKIADIISGHFVIPSRKKGDSSTMKRASLTE